MWWRESINMQIIMQIMQTLNFQNGVLLSVPLVPIAEECFERCPVSDPDCSYFTFCPRLFNWLAILCICALFIFAQCCFVIPFFSVLFLSLAFLLSLADIWMQFLEKMDAV